jgi:hypothetical protein
MRTTHRFAALTTVIGPNHLRGVGSPRAIAVAPSGHALITTANPGTGVV